MKQLAIVAHSGDKIISTNSAFDTLSGYQSVEVLGRNPLDLVAPECHDRVRQKIATQDESPYVATVLCRDGSPRVVAIQAKTIQFRTETLRVAVIRSLAEAGYAQWIDDEGFVRNLVHGLRSPLSNMQMALQLMPQARPEQRQQYYDLVMRECDRELAMINQLLELEQGRMQAADCLSEPLNWYPWMEQLLEPYQLWAGDRGLNFNVEIPANLPEILTLPDLLRRILQELLTNACKYTEPGGSIGLTVQVTEQTLELSISNTAQIPETSLPYVFDAFYQAHGAMTVSQPGSGLGLTLVRQMVELIDGEIDVTSQHHCTTFRVGLPLILR